LNQNNKSKKFETDKNNREALLKQKQVAEEEEQK
jgi:hypothetical protein